jgi:hypothetical protein|tara:strand:- start:4439 stop:4756 length:318 start_codon:yes stop_codon:yes gene_type:complete
MSKNQIEILDYMFFNGNLSIQFCINNEEEYRDFEICEDVFHDYLEKCGNLELFTDEWDYATESHYTKDWVISYDDYIEDYLENNDLLEFIIDYFSNKDYPIPIKE